MITVLQLSCFCMWKICKGIFNLYLHSHHLFADRHLSDVWVLRFVQFSENIIRFFIIITINLFYITFFSWDNEPSKYWLQNKFRKNKSSLPHQKRQLFHFYHAQSANCPNTSPLIYIVSVKPSFTILVKSDSKFAIYDGHSSFRGEVEYLGEMIIVKVFETTA